MSLDFISSLFLYLTADSDTAGGYGQTWGPVILGTHADEYEQWHYTKTKTNTNPNHDPNRYRRRCPDPNARIQKFIH